MAVNYAEQYSKELANAYPYSLYFGKLWSTENENKYKVVDAKTIKIPSVSTGGRVNGSRTSIGNFTQNFSNEWETKTLTNHRNWQTLVHPQDVEQTNQVASISNITKTMNETQKFPEMDAQLISTLYTLKNAQAPIVQETVALTVDNVLTKFDTLMDEMDEALVPVTGRLLYVDTFTKTLIDNAISISRMTGTKAIDKRVTRIEEVEVIGVPTKLMKTEYDFANGWEVKGTAKDIAMLLVHPSAVYRLLTTHLHN